jgi:hypothetical protein
MTFKDINFNPDNRELRTFSGLWLLAFGLLGGIMMWRGGAWAPALLAVATVGGAVGLWQPRAMRPVYVAWMVAAFPIGWTVSLILLALVYYVVFTAFGLVFRVLGRDPLGRSFNRAAPTYWVPRRQPASAERYFRQV